MRWVVERLQISSQLQQNVLSSFSRDSQAVSHDPKLSHYQIFRGCEEWLKFNFSENKRVTM